MFKNKILIVAILGVCLISGILFILYNRYEAQRLDNMAKAFFDYQNHQLTKGIDEAKHTALALAVLLAENNHINDCFIENDRDKCLANIDRIISDLEPVFIYKDLKIHLHTNDLKSFVRSWDHDKFGDNLHQFRAIVRSVAKHKKPTSGIENGIVGTYIRAAAPIFKKQEMLGSIEVILSFDYISTFFKDQGIDLFVLLDKDKAKYREPKKGDDIMKNHFISNLKIANLNLVPILNKLDLLQDGFVKSNAHYFSIKPIVNFSGERIGSFVLHINSDFKDKNILQEHLFLNPLF
ncbi:MAG: chemotaxis protein [Campylobacter sp.]|nr:chemotaxis protein [Campylobacter sp.]